MAGKLVNLLYIDDRLSEIAQINKSIRQLGYIVRDARADSAAEIQQAIAKVEPDLVFVGLQRAEPSLSSVAAAVADTGCDAPIIALAHEQPAPNRTAALQQGARDVVESADMALLLRVCERELEDLRTRKRARQLEAMLREANQRCDSLLDSSREAIAYVHEGAHVYVNHAYLEMFGYDESGQLEGLPLMNMVIKEDRDRIKHLLRDFGRGRRDCDRAEAAGLCADGSEFEVELQLQPASVEGEPCVQVLFQRASIAPSLEIKLTELHQRDMLTGLYNRQHFMAKLEDTHVKVKKGDSGGALMYILLDQYRRTCEDFGLTTGEGLVKEIAEVVRQLSDEDQLLARFSENVITVLSPEYSEQALLSRARSLRRKIEDHVLLSDSRMITTSCCIGVCPIDPQFADTDAMVAAADKACEAARQSEGERIEFYRAAQHFGNREEGNDEAFQIKRAMNEGRLTLLFQPIASLRDAEDERYALRVMILGEDGSLRDPDASVMESSELEVAADLDNWAIERACELLAESAAQEGRILLFLPVSARTLADPSRLCELSARLAESADLVVEIAEQLAEHYYRQSLELCRRMHNQGVRITLSDFGMSKNAVRLIGLLQPDYVKFSSRLVDELPANEQYREFVESISETMKDAGGETIAVDITSAQQLASIWQTPMTLIQGDFVAAPSESMEFDFEQFVA